MEIEMPRGKKLWSDDTGADEARQAKEEISAEPTAGLQAESTGMDPSEQQEKQHGSAELGVDDFTELKEKVIGAVPPQYQDSWMQQRRPTIYVVPSDLAAGKTDPYAPAAVCIGPFFGRARRVTEGMAKLERYKWCCVRKLIVGRRRGPGPAGTRRQPPADWKPEVHEPLLRRCVDAMTSLLPRIRASYSISSSLDTVAGGGDGDGGNAMLELKMLLEPEDADMDMGSTLAENMLLDGCFILHRLLKMARKRRAAGKRSSGGGDDDDDDWTQAYGRCGVWGLVTRDLLLLNNQIPLFVVRALLEQLKGPVDADEGDDDVLVDGGLQLFGSLHPRRLQPPAPAVLGEAHHLLHLFYLSITNLPVPIPTQSASSPEDKKLLPELTQWVPCAKELEDAGVRIRARVDGTATSFLDIRFSAGGVLEIPPLQLYDYSEPLFRNLVAFEQTYPGTPGHVTAYAIFMDCLVKTSDDMRLLHRRGILLNHMNGDREAATAGFFSSICAGALASADRNYLAPLMDEVVTYQSGSWPQWRAALLRDYFGSPWAAIAVVVAAFVVALTVLQTFYALYAYYQPPKQT